MIKTQDGKELIFSNSICRMFIRDNYQDEKIRMYVTLANDPKKVEIANFDEISKATEVLKQIQGHLSLGENYEIPKC